ncbi:MAG: hypothetical protein WCY58_01410 [Mariniphaga sp.]|nr:hypothetical protein [Mariniphaga sp.]MDD4226600.1 hypothetical protein [Mariniphaga sp.]
MKNYFYILLCLFVFCRQATARSTDSCAFRWGNGCYYQLDIGQSFVFQGTRVKLLRVVNHYNQLQVGADTLWLKVARRSEPHESGELRVFVADNKNVKALASNREVHGLLTGDALVCLSSTCLPLLDPGQYTFPVSFNEGFTWSMEEESCMFSFYNSDETGRNPLYRSYEGIGLNLHEARGKPKHWVTAIENSRVVWVSEPAHQDSKNETTVLLASVSQPGIYYCYSRLFSQHVAVRKGQKLNRGDLIGTVWGDNQWGHLQFTVIHATKEPGVNNCFHQALNGFPQLVSLYARNSKQNSRSFNRGRITFGKPRWLTGNQKNNLAFEELAGKGWVLGSWCTPDKVEWVARSEKGNVRLKKVMFENTPDPCTNPHDFFEYQINVQNGNYRIRAKVGDQYLPSWQKIEYNRIPAATLSLHAGQTEWTGERIVNVQDGKITVRIYIDKENEQVAGLEEIVFQQAY